MELYFFDQINNFDQIVYMKLLFLRS